MIAKRYKFLIILFFLILVISCLSSTVKAAGDTLDDIKNWDFTPSIGKKSGSDSSDDSGSTEDKKDIDDTIYKYVGWGINVIKTASIFVAIISIIFLGINTIMGAPEEKAVNKDKIKTLVIGILFMSSITAIVSFIFDALLG